jgi:glycosyltransferase involved in cell wall biosynthesis
MLDGDAITNHILQIDARLKAWGLDSQIYAHRIEPPMQRAARPDADYEPYLSERDDWLIYHYSIYSPNLKLLQRSRNRRIAIYHNITPPHFFRGFDRGMEAICRVGRLALPTLRDCDLLLADSDFNRRELVEAGIPAERTGVLPIFLDLGGLATARRNKRLYRRLTRNHTKNLLFVGRVVPNKAHVALIKAFYFFHRHIDTRSQLWLVGSSSLPTYEKLLRSLIARLHLEQAVTLTGRVSLGELRTYYEAANLFLSASQHEGFCVPLLESMHFELPILAYNCTAVPETLGNSGVLFNQYRYNEIAETAHLLLTDADLRQQVIRRQRQRLDEFRPAKVEARLHQILVQLGVLR